MFPFFTLSGTECFSCLGGGTPLAGSLAASSLLRSREGRWMQEVVTGPHGASVVMG